MKFNQLSETTIGENVDLVISERSDGKISIAQRVTAEANGREHSFFVKNAIETRKENLENIIETLEEAKQEIKEEINNG